MDKATIAEIRKVVKNPVEFIEKRVDACTLFLTKHLEISSWLFAVVVLSAITSVVLPSDRHRETNRSLSSSMQANSNIVGRHFDSKNKASPPAVGIQQPESALKTDKSAKTSVWTDVSDRIRRFPLTTVVSVRPADSNSKVKWALSLKFVDQVVYQPVFSDEFLDTSNKPVVSYGIYFDTYSATKPIWEPLVTAEHRKGMYQRLATSLLTMRNYFFAQRSSNEDVEDTVARTIALMQSDISQPPFIRTQSNFPIGRSASFNLPSADRRLQLSRMFDEVATPERGSSASEGMQRTMSRLVHSVQTSFVFRIDILKTLIIKIEQ